MTGEPLPIDLISRRRELIARRRFKLLSVRKLTDDEGFAAAVDRQHPGNRKLRAAWLQFSPARKELVRASLIHQLRGLLACYGLEIVRSPK